MFICVIIRVTIAWQFTLCVSILQTNIEAHVVTTVSRDKPVVIDYLAISQTQQQKRVLIFVEF